MSNPFSVQTTYQPCGDQPGAIASLTDRLGAGQRYLTLLGVTGSGKTFTMAKVIETTQRPALILAPNKTLASQLFSEMKELFPNNAVEYFVSYYDYYQPEAYVPSSDTYIAKDASINDHIDRMRHSATYSLLTRRDVIIVASVSCIYGLGSPEAYGEMRLDIKRGAAQDRDDLLRRLVQIQYSRNDIAPRRGTFRARGDIVEIFPAYADDRLIRVEFFGDEIENLLLLDSLKGEVLEEPPEVTIFPSSHYVTSRDRLEVAIRTIETELDERLAYFRSVGKLLEAQRLEMRTKLDLELLIETGTCPGIENYSRHLDGRGPGEPPATLVDYFPKDFIAFVDESHVSMPQVAGMYRGDRARKETLVEFGFRLPSAVDNRPLKGEEFDTRVRQLVAVSATPSDLDVQRSEGVTAEQVIRPTGLVDPKVEIRPARGQVDDLLGEIRTTVDAGHRVLVTSLTKRMCEDLTTYYRDLGLKVKYLHSDIETLERMAILRSLRLGEFDTLVGVNLLREGLDLPEVALVAILDADKEGFLRSHRSLIQTIGRAARNVEGRVILYADHMTESIKAAVQETDRRRSIQEAYNEQHGITPQTVQKKIAELMETIYEQDYVTVDLDESDRKVAKMTQSEVEQEIRIIRDAMLDAAKEQRYEDAALLRDRMRTLEKKLSRGY